MSEVTSTLNWGLNPNVARTRRCSSDSTSRVQNGCLGFRFSRLVFSLVDRRKLERYLAANLRTYRPYIFKTERIRHLFAPAYNCIILSQYREINCLNHAFLAIRDHSNLSASKNCNPGPYQEGFSRSEWYFASCGVLSIALIIGTIDFALSDFFY